jgi:hypothetical protein
VASERIYVPLADEGVEVWAPVVADVVGEATFKLPDTSPSDESWQFEPGSTVACELRTLDAGPALVAVRKA